MIQFPARTAQGDSGDRGEFEPLPQPPSPTAARWGENYHNNESTTSLDTTQNSRLPTLQSGSHINLINNYSSAIPLIGSQTSNILTPGPSTPGPSSYGQSSTFHGDSFSDTSSYDGATACPTPALQDESISYEEYKKQDLATPRQVRHFNTFDKKYDTSVYQIETLHKYDDEIFLPPWKRNMYRLSPLFTFLACGSYFLYYSFRIFCIIDVQRAYDKIYIMAWLFIAAEGCVACKYLPSIPVSAFNMCYRSRRIPSILQCENFPVDYEIYHLISVCQENHKLTSNRSRSTPPTVPDVIYSRSFAP